MTPIWVEKRPGRLEEKEVEPFTVISGPEVPRPDVRQSQHVNLSGRARNAPKGHLVRSWWFGYGGAADQGAVHEQWSRRFLGYALELGQELLNGPCAHLVVRESHRCEAWKQPVGDDFLVVEADDRDVFRNAQTNFSGGSVGAHRHPIVVAEQGSGAVWPL